jgi:hypothetical protein
MRTTSFAWLLLLIGPLDGGAALADGGLLRCSQQMGDLRISVFTSPSPVRAGPIDVSVLVQDVQSGDVARKPDVQVKLVSHDGQHHVAIAEATFAAAENKLFRAAKLNLPAPGRWDVRVECQDKRLADPICVSFSIDAGDAAIKWYAAWPWLTWPAAVVVLFAIHRTLVWQKNADNRRKARRNLRTTRTTPDSNL